MMMSHWLDVLNNAQFHFRSQAAEAEAAALHATAPTMIGIGIVLKANSASGLFTVENVVEGGPADKSQKFQIGDYLVEVDGHDTYQSEFDTVLGWIRGELGTFVSIVVARVTDGDLMQSPATSDNPYGDAAEFLSIELRRDIVKKIDIYAQFPFPTAVVSSGSAAAPPATAPKQAPLVPPQRQSGVAASAAAEPHRVSAAGENFAFEGCLGKSKGSGLMGMMGYQDRYFTLNATHLTW
jgi:hypothetical protein